MRGGAAGCSAVRVNDNRRGVGRRAGFAIGAG